MGLQAALVVEEQTGYRIIPFRVSGARTGKFAGYCKFSKNIGLSSVCSLHKSTCFGFVSWFCFNVQFFCFYVYVLPAEMGSQIRPKEAVRQFDEEDSDQFEAKKPNAFFT